jgi:hypothetical protein
VGSKIKKWPICYSRWEKTNLDGKSPEVQIMLINTFSEKKRNQSINIICQSKN